MRPGTATTRILLALTFAACTPVHVQAGTWKEDFDRICARTLDAHSLSNDKIHKLIEDSDALLKRIRDSSEASKKVYVFRLEKCKKFFQYILDLRASGADEDAQGGGPK